MIKWLPYSKEAFKKAEVENKPVFLHIFARWSSYCKKMKEELFDDPEIAEAINKSFIPIMVNRDERPDIDSIYQKASYIIGKGSGWPLNLFLDKDGKPFSGVVYKMNEGKDYFKTTIDKTVELFRTEYEKVLSRSQVVFDAIKPIEVVPSDIREELIQNPEEDIVKEIDFDYGGFKKTPKFPPYAHIDLLLWKYWIRQKPWVLNAIEKTLKGMIFGGLYDNIEGGFHRYCIDKAWMVPHFEKLAVDNAWHVINLLDAYNILKDSLYIEIAMETINYIRKNLFSEEGFFCSSQFADSFYYTWEERELEEVSPLTIALVDGKAMVDGRFILIGRDRELIKQLKDKFLARRKQRPSPEIDKTLYGYVNGICAEAFIKAWRVLKDRDLLNKAIIAIDKTLSYLLTDENFYRTKEKTPALIDDYAYMISALISAYEVTAEKKYIDKAVTLTNLAVENLWDQKNGGFYDSPEEILSIRQKNIHDTPYPSSNSIMIINLLKLHAILDVQKYMNFSTSALKAFSNLASAYLSPYYVKALVCYFDLLTLNLYTSRDSLIGKAAVHQITPFTVIAHRQKEGDYIIPSVGNKKFDPIRSPEDLANFLRL
ncbi:MAG: DUF255 domain-containing protein [Thermodesulfovibrio sp.]|nr:DUF255 domain-containing protein [Thermodesulfovibrio sp.]MCX7724359.1 DUF255 domain-containing protein [Thermodesulfovibrio sp.]